MIDANEIDEQAERIGVHAANVQRDYVFGWLLKGIYEHDLLRNALVFKGGNCMRKAYYPKTRFSSDLDFSVSDQLDVQRFQAAFNDVCRSAQDGSDVEFDLERNTLKPDEFLDEDRRSYKGRLYFYDFYGQPGSVTISVRVDLTEFDRLALPAVTRPLHHEYSDADACVADLRCMALEELVANKLKCLIQRRHSFDLYDLVYATFFDRSIELDRLLVMRTFLKKTIFGGSPGSAKQILLGLPMTFFSVAWEKYVAPIASRISFENAERAFRSVIEAFFEGAGGAPLRTAFGAFYPPEFRNVILEAGHLKRVLSLTYDDGRPRAVEPYSLSYRRRKDGHAGEYLFAWDRTGGRTSAPGIKMFVPDKIQRLTLTEEGFEPRFPVELSKAGERVAQEEFSGRTSEVTRAPRARKFKIGPPRRATLLNPFKQSFSVQCPYCHKRFTRTTRDLTLRAHKSPSGYPCSGRKGYPVL